MPKDIIRTFEDLLSKAQNGDQKACIDLQDFFIETSNADQFQEIALRVSDLHQQQPDNPFFNNLMGLIKHKGFGCPRDYKMAKVFYERAIELDDPDAMVNRADMDRCGQGGPVNPANAIRLYERGIELGNSRAMNNRGLMHQAGNGGPVDYASAIDLFERAIELNHLWAMANRAHMHRFGEGGTKNLEAAFALLKKSYHATTLKKLQSNIIKQITKIAEENLKAGTFLAKLYNSVDPNILVGDYHKNLHASVLEMIVNGKKDLINQFIDQYLLLLTRYVETDANAVLALLKQNYKGCNLGLCIALREDTTLVKRYLDFLNNVNLNVNDKLDVLKEQSDYLLRFGWFKTTVKKENFGMVVSSFHDSTITDQYLSLLNKFAETHADNVLSLLNQKNDLGSLLRNKISFLCKESMNPYIQLLTKISLQGYKIDYALISGCKSYKEVIYDYINNLSLTEKIKACEAALDPSHSLGKIMRIRRGFFNPNLKSGTLKKIVILRDEAKKQAQAKPLLSFLHVMNKQRIFNQALDDAREVILEDAREIMLEDARDAFPEEESASQSAVLHARSDYEDYLNYQKGMATQLSSESTKNVPTEFPFLQALIDGTSFPDPALYYNFEKFEPCTNQSLQKNIADDAPLSQNNWIDLSSACIDDFEHPMAPEKSTIQNAGKAPILFNASKVMLFSQPKNHNGEQDKKKAETINEKNIKVPKEKPNRSMVLA